MPAGGFEPPRLSASDFKSAASTVPPGGRTSPDYRRSAAAARVRSTPDVEMAGYASVASLRPPLASTQAMSSARRIRLSLASGVRNAECADSVTFSSRVRG